MIGEIIAIGTEVVTGDTLNTNAFYLARELVNLGVDVEYHTSVDDDFDRLSKVFEIALDRSDLIITTGGLGPTQDDISKEVVSKVLGLPLEEDLDMFNNIKKLFEKSGRPVTENNKRQCFKPKGSKFLKNITGTAPGIFLEHENKTIIMLPGPPKELKPMFENEVVPLINENSSIVIESINTIGIGESMLETRLLDLNLNPKYTEVNTYAGDGVQIKLIGKGNNSELVEREVFDIKNIIYNDLKDYIYSYGNISIEEYLIEELDKNNLTIGFCESCTGGLLASQFTKVPGASKVFDRSLVTYSNEAKMSELKVKKETLNKYGAVSEETAYEMAKGLLSKSDLDLAISITGIAGPDSDNTKKPVGLVYICVMDRDLYKVNKYNFYGTREAIQNKSALKAKEMLRSHLIKNFH